MKFLTIFSPTSVNIDSGWNWTALIGKLLWRIPIISPNSSSAVISRWLGKLSLNAIQEWYLAAKNFDILPYINADPILAKQLEEIGCVTVMPLGSPIGSNQGLKNLYNIKIIVEGANVPVIVDAGIGTPSQASEAMELGASGVLTNTAVAKAFSAKDMAYAMKLGVEAGRLSYLAGTAPKQSVAQPSSPTIGLFM